MSDNNIDNSDLLYELQLLNERIDTLEKKINSVQRRVDPVKKKASRKVDKLVKGHSVFARPLGILQQSVRGAKFGFKLLQRRIAYGRGKIQDNKLFVMTHDNNFSCNQKYVVLEVLRQQLPIDIVWARPAGKNVTVQFPEGVRSVPRGSYEMFQEQTSAKIWLDNALNCVWFEMPKRKEQVYLNTWHGAMGIKRLSGNWMWMKRASRCDKVTDFCVTNSAFEEDVFRDTFWPNTPFLQFGHPRNDILFKPGERQAIRARAAKALGVSADTKWLLYAPTFRDGGDTSWYDLDYETLKAALEERFGGSWTILVRMHFKDVKKLRFRSKHEWLVNAGGYPDIQELLVCADAGVTDYSSWAYDYILTRRPLFLYAPDIEKYNDTRGFYYPLETTPFPIARNNAEMAKNIAHFDNAAYQERVQRFLDDKGCYEDGHAAERVVEKIKEIMNI